jgi:transposase
MVHLELTDAQRRELCQVSRQAVGRVAWRAHRVLLSGRGCPVPRIALIHACGEDVVRTWLHRYPHLGVAGLSDSPKSGRPPKDRLAGPILEAPASPSPRCAGQVPATWSVGRLARFVASRCRPRLSVRSGRRSPHRIGGRGARPRRAPATARHPDPESPVKRAARADAWTPARAGRAPLRFWDEADRPRLPVVRARWMKGPRGRVPTPGENAKPACFGALEAISGQWRGADHHRQLAVHFVALLDQRLAAYPTGPLYLVLDGAPIHTAKVVARWAAAHPRAHWLWRPKYAAHEVHPAERLWGWLKSEVAADRLDGHLATLVGHARRFCAELAPHPVKPPAAA